MFDQKQTVKSISIWLLLLHFHFQKNVFRLLRLLFCFKEIVNQGFYSNDSGEIVYFYFAEALDKAINEHDSSTSDSVTGSVDSVQRMPDLLDITR